MSDFLVWTEKYATGVETIDGDHQTLFMMVNALNDAMAHDDAPAQMPGLFSHLIDYTRTHFAREEALMAEHGYPMLDEHREKHRQLTETLARMLDDFEAAPETFPVDGLMDFLKDWLTSHVLKSDMDYVPFVKGGFGA